MIELLFKRLELAAVAELIIPGLHPGLCCSTPLGWLFDHSLGGLAVTTRSAAMKMTLKGSHRRAQGVNPGKGRGLPGSTLKGLNKAQAISI